MTEWLEYENPPQSQAGQEDTLLRLALEDDLTEITKPEMPEILALLRESRQLNIPIYNGSLMDLPYVFHLELATCEAVIDEFWAIRAANQRLWEQHQDAHSPGPEQ